MPYEKYKHLGTQSATAKPTAGLVSYVPGFPLNVINNIARYSWCVHDLAVVLLRKLTDLYTS